MSVNVLRVLALLALVPAGSMAAREIAAVELMKRDVGVWKVELRVYGAPGAEPLVSEGTETNVLVGDLWLVGHFEGEIMGSPFAGSRRTGFDPAAKEFVSSWVDSTSPYATNMSGEWNEDTQTLSLVGAADGPQGFRAKWVATYHDDGSRSSALYRIVDGTESKVLEFHYVKASD